MCTFYFSFLRTVELEVGKKIALFTNVLSGCAISLWIALSITCLACKLKSKNVRMSDRLEIADNTRKLEVQNL